ncbi:MAG: ATPase [Blautia sp.]
MVQETIQAVKETENQAEQILKDAAVQADAIVKKAREDAAALKEEQMKAAKEKAASDMENTKAGEAGKLDQLDGEVQKEIAALRELAAAKEEQAIDMVISQLY